MDPAPGGQGRGGLELQAELQAGPVRPIEASTLVLVGSASPPEPAEATGCVARAIPGARIQVLDDHGYMAYNDPILVADLIGTFVSTGVRA